jgi:hypothetical protein
MKRAMPSLIILTLITGLIPLKAKAAGEINIYVVPAITNEIILPDTSISSSYLSNQISITAAPGEYEPASFVLRANEDITGLQVTSDDLTGTAGTIPSANVDIRVVKSWIKRDQPFGGPYGSVAWHTQSLTPELLLKDDSLIKVENGENYVKLTDGTYKWISDETEAYPGIETEIIPVSELPIQDASTLQPVDIEAGTNKQFWITLEIPDNASDGVYTGNIELRTSSRVIGEIQLTAEVLPIQLSDPNLVYGLYYRGAYDLEADGSIGPGSISSEHKNEVQLIAELEDMYNHGLSNPMLYRGPCEQWYGWSSMIQQLQIRNELGLATDEVFIVNVAAGDRESVLNTLLDYGVQDVYFYIIEEFGSESLPSVIATCDQIHAIGAKVITAIGSALSHRRRIAGSIYRLCCSCRWELLGR